MTGSLAPAFRRLWRVLTFRFDADDVLAFGRADLAVGLAFTWIAGVGRYWDDERATLLQQLGVGSLIYVVVLSALLWIIARPLTHAAFTYGRLLTFVTFTAPPALLYAIPIECLVDLKTGNVVNLAFLLTVSIWRVGLYSAYLLRFGSCGWMKTTGLVLLPIGLIVTFLAILNLQHVVLNIMGGIREADKSVHDASYGMLIMLTYLSFPVTVITAIWWLSAIAIRAFDRDKPA